MDNILQRIFGIPLKKYLILMLLAVLSVSVCASAEENGERGDTQSYVYEKLEPFTVNLIGLLYVIQVSITLKPATLIINNKVKQYMPVIRHEIILVLSSKTREQLETSEGKQNLISEIRDASNKALGVTTQNGITDVFFETLIIQ